MPDAYNLPSEDEVLQIVYSYFQAQPSIADAPLGEGCFEGDLGRALAGVLSSCIEAQRGAYQDGVPSVQVDEAGAQKTPMSSAGLDRWAFALGIPSNRGPGKFGRNVAQAATGGSGTATGTPGVIVPAGSLLTDPSGAVVLQLRVGVVIGVAGTASVTIDAQTTGRAGNLPAGTKLRWQSPPIGLGAGLTLSGALTEGYDVESDLSLALRILDYLQNPVSGGTAADIRRWAVEAKDADGRLVGIVEAYVWPHRSGTGTADYMPLLGGSGRGRDPGATKLADVQAYTDAREIETDTITAIRPFFAIAEDLTVFYKILPAPRNQFDWDPGVSIIPIIVTGTAGTTSIVINQATPPGDLGAKIDGGKKPRFHSNFAAFSPIPFQARITAHADNTPIAGQCTLTLDTALPVNVPGNTGLWPGGPAVLPIAFACLDYIDHVGPSRESGYAAEEWEDSVSIARLAQAAIDARDDAGDRVCVTLPNTGNFTGSPPVGVRIAVGVAAATTEDYNLHDNGSGPQLPVCAGIIVSLYA